MNLHFDSRKPLDCPHALLAVPVFSGAKPGHAWKAVDARLNGIPGQARDAGDLTGKDEQQLLVWRPSGDADSPEGPQRVLLLGAGDPKEWDMEAARGWAGRAVRVAEGLSLGKMALVAESPGKTSLSEIGQALAEGAALAAWEFRELRTPEGYRQPPARLVEEVSIHATVGKGKGERLEEGVRVGSILAEGENLARTLQARPGNVATPTHLAQVASDLADEVGLEVEIWGPRELKREKMHALLAVAQGSVQEPRFIILRHRGGKKKDAPLVLVGKGLTFDNGGISLKPPAGMEDMKYDMSGGAAVLGAMRIAARLKLPTNVVGLIPSSENLVSGAAMKPGDVIGTRAGLTVEVINTDAEGRLILADALSYGRSLTPAAMVDCATLTGACVVALGNETAAVLGTSPALVKELRAAGDRSGERCWELPLWEVYRKQLDSECADLKNVGGRPAGTITAAHFLRAFVGDVDWAHLDIAGVAYGDSPRPYLRKGAYGLPTRLLAEWLLARAG
ncbi:MAG: leucyl aminopeptidase [Gemmatimonadota bacterium]